VAGDNGVTLLNMRGHGCGTATWAPASRLWNQVSIAVSQVQGCWPVDGMKSSPAWTAKAMSCAGGA